MFEYIFFAMRGFLMIVAVVVISAGFLIIGANNSDKVKKIVDNSKISETMSAKNAGDKIKGIASELQEKRDKIANPAEIDSFDELKK